MVDARALTGPRGLVLEASTKLGAYKGRAEAAHKGGTRVDHVDQPPWAPDSGGSGWF